MTEDYFNLDFLTSVLFIFQFWDFARVPTSCGESTFYTENFQIFFNLFSHSSEKWTQKNKSLFHIGF
jgi:hypothetical protein